MTAYLLAPQGLGEVPMACDASAWIDREIAGCRFADERLNRRLRALLGQMAGAMGESIPLACQDWANTKAAYRFFANERVSEGEILGGHFRSTRDRSAGVGGPIMVLHGTTEFSYRREAAARAGRSDLPRQQRQGQAGPVPHAHRPRAPDALQPGRHGRGAAAGLGGREVLDEKEVQGHRRPEAEGQSHRGTHRA